MVQIKTPTVSGPTAFMGPSEQDHVAENVMIEMQNFSAWYADFQALHDLNLSIPEKRVTAFILSLIHI